MPSASARTKSASWNLQNAGLISRSIEEHFVLTSARMAPAENSGLNAMEKFPPLLNDSK